MTVHGAIAPPAGRAPSQTKLVVRWVAVFVSFIPMGWAAYNIAEFWSNRRQLVGGALILEPLRFTDPVKAAAEQKLKAAEATLQHSLLVLAALWGLFIAKKKDEQRLTFDSVNDLPENLVFVVATVVLVASWFCYHSYSDAMATIHARAAPPSEPRIPNFLDQRIDAMTQAQSRLFMIGAFLSGWVFFSTHMLKEETP